MQRLLIAPDKLGNVITNSKNDIMYVFVYLL